MAMVRKKQDDKYLEALRELITTGGGNRQCFDCGQKGPTYVNMTIGSFVCTRCSGVLRGITPPHRVKSISMATFTQDEIDFLKAHGNDVCAKTWLGLWDPKRAVHQDQRELMIDKYERKRYYLEPASPLKSLTNATNLKTTTSTSAATSSTSSASVTASSANSSQNNTNNKTQIQLTPPTSQRTTANGLHKTSSTAISRPQHTTPQPQNGFSSSLSNHTTDAFGLHNGLNSSVGSMSTGALSDTSSCASANGFGAEADFVADFGSADIFNATVASSPASSVGSSTTNNGYAKIQPMKMSAAAHQQFMNGHGVGGGNNANTNLQNGNLSNGNTENFADFDHAPIYNAAVEEPANYQFVRKNAIRKKSTSSASGSIIRRNERQLKDILEMDNNENAVDYINFNEDDVFGETKATTTNTTKSGGYSNLFDDFDALLTLDDNRQQTNFKEFESDYANVGGDHLANGSKFTPLALAAHATAMAVLGNQSHFNSQLQTAEIATAAPFTNQWDFWSASKDAAVPANSSTTVAATTTPWFPNNNLIQQSYEVPATHQLQQQQHLYASITNFNSKNLHTNLQKLQHPQYFPSSTFSTQSLTQSSATIFETAKTTTMSTAVATITRAPTSIITTTPTTSLPINNNNNKDTTTNGFNNNNNNINNNNINNNNNSSAPAEDRYAALKDLDEQLRESKAVAAQAASIVTANVVDSGFGNPNVNGTVNPFAAHHHHQQQQQQHQQTAVVNPFQNASNNSTQNTTQQLFGQMTLIPNGIAAANGFLNAQKTHTANTGFFNYTASGFTNANTPQIQQQHQQQQQQHHQASLLYPTTIQTGPNGCGFGFGTLQQQIASTGTGLTTNTFNNPFAATGALNSNNPFL